MNSAQRFFEQGRIEGKREAELEAELRGERKMLRRVLSRKFGTLTPAVDERLASASQPALERWSDRIFAARTLDEVIE